MAENKTKPTSASVDEFIREFADTDQKRNDSYRLIELMKSVTGEEPVMWGPSIIGFGSVHYKYASGHEGDMPVLGFSPRKSALSLYVYSGVEKHRQWLEGLGKYKMGRVCIYAKKLSDLDERVLVKLMKKTADWVKKKYPSNED